MISWEKDESAPSTAVLSQWSDLGADILFIVTGRRTEERKADAAAAIRAELNQIRREVLNPDQRRLPDEDEGQAEARVLKSAENRLRAIVTYDRPLMGEECFEEARTLYETVQNPSALSLLRVADRKQLRERRDAIREGLSEWLDGADYFPNEAVTYLLVVLAMEYGAPVRFLAELIDEVHRDITDPTKDPHAAKQG